MAVSDLVVSIGTSSRDYSTIAAAEASIPTDLTAVEEWNISNVSGGPFTLDESLSFSPSGATGTYLEDDGSTMIFELLSGTVTAADSVTGGASSATADIDANVHKDGATWTGECYNDAEFLNSSEVIFAGSTVDATRNVTLTAAAGESFADHADKLTNALTYNVSNGVGIRRNTSYESVIQTAYVNFTLSRLQLRHNNGGTNSWIVDTSGNNTLVDGCIVYMAEAEGGIKLGQSGSRAVNCLVISAISSALDGPYYLRYNSNAYNCTAVFPDDLTGLDNGFEANYNVSDALNCASFGFPTGFGTSAGGSYSSSPASGNNATDDTTAPGASNQVSKTFSNQYEDVNDATQDFRVKAGSDLEGNGTRDEGNTNDLDIIGQSRSLTTPTIGCWEFIPAAADVIEVAPLESPVPNWSNRYFVG